MNDSSQEKKDKIFERLKIVLESMLKSARVKDPVKRPTVDWNTDLMDDLGIDSVDVIDLMNAIEEEFSVNPNINDANTKRKVFQIVDYIIELEKESE